jgi:hypothetical protein
MFGRRYAVITKALEVINSMAQVNWIPAHRCSGLPFGASKATIPPMSAIKPAMKWIVVMCRARRRRRSLGLTVDPTEQPIQHIATSRGKFGPSSGYEG